MKNADLLLVPLTREEIGDQNRPVTLCHPGREQYDPQVASPGSSSCYQDHSSLLRKDGPAQDLKTGLGVK